jgi:hypothetical protein
MSLNFGGEAELIVVTVLGRSTRGDALRYDFFWMFLLRLLAP